MASWEGVSEFVAVAETSSFTQAAKRLVTSVANVSRRIALLEERLGVKLLLRTTRKVSLTEAGQVYYQQCRALLEGLDQAELTVTQMQQTPRGKLKVTAPVTYGEQKIAPLLNGFLLQHPKLELELVLTNQKLDLIEQGVDVAVRLGQLDDSSFIARRLSNRHLYVCATPDYLAQCGTPHTLSELTKHSCLVGTYDHWRFKENQQSRSIRVKGRLSCSSGVVLLDAVLKGMGLAQLPDYYVEEHLLSGRLVEVLPSYRDDREGVWALYPQNRHLSPKVRLLVDYLAQHLSAPAMPL
ncbi:LysR family transcriptional regulator [Vibrio fluvialis]|jgi:DNA-binding transcriptional LysR family regulator|uniref:LysR substrate-binding domain-containing protein n=1 Tax=Vibrio fluvialis TaxID=676 RepID=UPI0006E32287|nr:LysR substrate-binding domain-containing protein [Vibrio fluvialis]EKO3437222.1 LysR family transcriptional regulator [Vibrio fluvialis]EKO3554269.1 LysR family transcriptional regulator [Vibrio fluvialis]EKO3972317.1 LysR family transcriptional regulator [Vibrio fluvialis]KQH91057.1 LysR family transcriptional regulator [Vibrio fluvialis]MBY7813290.1 LysR family transcriptional regulator [Vibrio fluvialis]